MWKRKRRRDMADVNIYTAERLSEMARSLGVLARACNDRMEEERGLTREDALAAMQTAAAGAICTATRIRMEVIICIICSAPLSRRAGWNMRTCPGCFWKRAGIKRRI